MNKILRKGFLLLFLLVGLVFALGGCTKPDLVPEDMLSMEEKLEDYTYMYNILKVNYPFFKVNMRLHGVDWLANEEIYLERINKTRTDDEFRSALADIVGELNNGHTRLVSDSDYAYIYQVLTRPELQPQYQPWVEVLTDSKVQNRYQLDLSLAKELTEGYADNPVPAFKKDIIIPGEVAYLQINAMEFSRGEKDGLLIRQFFEEVQDFGKLIIDIRGNSGGSDAYWQINVVSALVKEKITVDHYLFSRGNYGNRFYAAKGLDLRSIEMLEQDIPNEIKESFDSYWVQTTTIEPMNSIRYEGKIYLLIDSAVFSSADSFAAFCKDSGFATLVGETTRGDGIGIDPLFFPLPNSGYVIGFSSVMALNGDYTINEEVKTVPDVIVDATKAPGYKDDPAIQYVLKDNAE